MRDAVKIVFLFTYVFTHLIDGIICTFLFVCKKITGNFEKKRDCFSSVKFLSLYKGT